MEEQKSLDALLYRFKKLRYINKIAGEYYSRKNKQIVIPSIIISAIASILSFLATSGGISEKEKEYLSIAVGCITILSTTLQTFSTTFGFNTRHDAFQRCADEYNKIYTKLNVEFYIDVAEADIADENKGVIYRIVQESMNNIAKHSDANNIFVH